MRFTDGSPVGGIAFAPSKFLGDWSALDGAGSIMFDHRTFQTGNFTGTPGYLIRLSGPGGSAEWISLTAPTSCPAGGCVWETLTVPIDEASWTLVSGTWSALLADVTQFELAVDLYSSTSGALNIDGFDNVRLPEPATVFLLALGLLSLSAESWRRR
jgi:hypothetical protein